MINLIPPDAQKQVKREYWVRVVSVWLMLCATALFIAAVVNVPVYILVRSQLDAYSSEYAQANIEAATLSESERAVKESNAIAQLLSRSHASVAFSTIIDEIEILSGNDVAITEVALLRAKNGMEPISVRGVAQSRLALTAFQTQLEAHTLFKNVVLPLSNLARDKDVAFSITLELEALP